ncbi:MAG TPA: polysaccharide biosynthesis tyrosine autokinase [Methylophilaceae bacterium]|jgi:chain length determinant protein tyrosine kinase EpsG
MIPNENNNLNPIAKVDNYLEYRIGAILVTMGKISRDDVKHIIEMQLKEKNLRFGDAAKRLKLITDNDIQEVISKQFQYPYNVDKSFFSSELISVYKPFSQRAEVYRHIRSQLMLSSFAGTGKSLVTFGIDAGSGNSCFAANLAVVFAQLGKKTLLIDANLRSPRQHKIFNLTSNLGLSDMIIGRADVQVIQKVRTFEFLSVLPAGTLPPNPQEITGGVHFNDILTYCSTIYDVILIDAPAFSVASDALNIAHYANNALLVCRKNHTQAKKLDEVIKLLERSDAKLEGSVLLDF